MYHWEQTLDYHWEQTEQHHKAACISLGFTMFKWLLLGQFLWWVFSCKLKNDLAIKQFTMFKWLLLRQFLWWVFSCKLKNDLLTGKLKKEKHSSITDTSLIKPPIMCSSPSQVTSSSTISTKRCTPSSIKSLENNPTQKDIALSAESHQYGHILFRQGRWVKRWGWFLSYRDMNQHLATA